MSKLKQYKSLTAPLPETTEVWNMYGKGVESIGRNNAAETQPIPEPNDDQMLVRVDSVGMCFSDVKLIRQGRNHPKLYNRDLEQEPTRLGHEAAITIVKVGKNLQDQFKVGQRLAVQPDIYQNGKSTAYGYTIPGGLIQYHLMGAEMLDTDAGVCLLPLEGDMGYAETALLEPWGCVMASYTQRRRLTPKDGGVMWIIGKDGDTNTYQFSDFLSNPATIILTDAPASVAELANATGSNVIVADGVAVDQIAAFAAEHTEKGFDDIVMLGAVSAEKVSTVAVQIARRGTLNLIGTEPLDGLVSADVGRLHYDYIAFVGGAGPDIAASYGEARNRCELQSNGTAIFVGAGGPMGQMHVQRAIELPNGPKLIIATEISQMRLDALSELFGPLAEANERTLLTFNPATSEESISDYVQRVTDGKLADDVVVSVPHAGLMAESDTLMNENGMLVLFAGVPNGTMAPINLSNVFLHNAQYTGTSGLTIDDQRLVMDRTLEGNLSPSRSVAAIGGMEAAQDGVVAMMESRYAGKIVIFPQITDLPLMGLNELAAAHPDIAAHLGPNFAWTDAAEEALIEKLWQPA